MRDGEGRGVCGMGEMRILNYTQNKETRTADHSVTTTHSPFHSPPLASVAKTPFFLISCS